MLLTCLDKAEDTNSALARHRISVGSGFVDYTRCAVVRIEHSACEVPFSECAATDNRLGDSSTGFHCELCAPALIR
jgi:hypothetical protein